MISRHWLFTIFTIFTLCLYLPALSAGQVQLVSTESDLDAFIQNSVNVINGDYCESATDLVITGLMLWCFSVFIVQKMSLQGFKKVDGECSLNDFLSLAKMLLENHAPWVKIDLNGPLLLRENARVESSLTAGGEIRIDPLKTHLRSIS